MHSRSVDHRPAREGVPSLLLAAALAAPATVLANKVVELDFQVADGAYVEVVSDSGRQWDRVSASPPPRAKLLLRYRCRYQGKAGFWPGVKSEVWIRGPLGGTWADDGMPGEAMRVVSVPLEPPIQGRDPVRLCNDALGSRMIQEDRPREYFLARGITLKTTAMVARLSLTCPAVVKGGLVDLEMRNVQVPATVRCVGTPTGSGKPAPTGDGPAPKPPPVPKPTKLVPLVLEARTTVEPALYRDRCPARFTVAGEVRLSRPGTIRFRYVNDRGERSRVRARTFGNAGTFRLAAWSHTPRPPAGDRGGLKDRPAGPVTRVGWYRLEVIWPTTVAAQRLTYRDQCRRVAGPGGVRSTAVPPSRRPPPPERPRPLPGGLAPAPR